MSAGSEIVDNTTMIVEDETERTTAERLVTLKNAVAVLTETFAVQHKDVATQLTEAIQEMTKIIEQQNLRLQGASRNSYGYVDWDASHEELSTHSYISLEDFDKNFRRYTREDHDDEESDEDEDFGDGMIETLNNAFKVNKTTRFPVGGKYVNINIPKLQDHIETIVFDIEHGLDFPRSRPPHQGVLNLVQKVDDMILNNKDGVHGLDDFENKYNLTWKDI